jgi:putative acetyltransferase
LILREEEEQDRDEIAALIRAAFGGDDEVGIVTRLHEDKLVALSLVALIGGRIVGQILFSELAVAIDGRRVNSLALAPMSVIPLRQRQGIGSRRVEESVGSLKRLGYEAAFVLGHHAYYPRFGFSSALAGKFAAPFSGEAFMALELAPGALDGEKGTVEYPDAFGIGAESDG